MLEVLQTISAILILVMGIVFFYQAAYLLVPYIIPKRKSKRTPGGVKKHRFAVLIAARNEQSVIPHLLHSIQSQDYPADLITPFVVADNCTDASADVARENGAVVYLRFNTEQVGKGYALNYLLERINEDYGWDQFDCYMIFDADNVLLPNYFTEMNKVCAEGYKAFTGYRNTKNVASSWVSAGYTIWYLHDSCHLNQSRSRLGLTCAVTGTGFGFTTELLKEMNNWNFFTLTEDIEFSTWCAVRGIRIGYCHDAILFDEQPKTFRQSWRQRTRWSQGGIQVTFGYTKEYAKGLIAGGRTTYSTLETLTLSLYGYMLGILCACISLATAFLQGGLGAAGILILSLLAGTYGSTFLLAAWTLVTEWKRIRATTWQKIFCAFCFPLYILTWAPISATAMFRKFEWTPIEHTEAVDVESLNK